MLQKLLQNTRITPEIIMCVVGTVSTQPTVDNLEAFYQVVEKSLTVPVTALAATISGKHISVLLCSILDELNRLSTNDTVYMEKYLLDHDAPIVKAKLKFTHKVHTSLRAEMLELFRDVGVRQTVLLYLLVIYHLSTPKRK